MLAAVLPFFLLHPAAEPKDHPLVSRFEGFVIKERVDTEFEQYSVDMPTSKTSKEGLSLSLQGKLSRINYMRNEMPLPSGFEVFENYRVGLEAKGATIIYSCLGAACDRGRPKPFDRMADEGVFVNDFMRFGKHAALAARFSRADKEFHIFLWIREEKNQFQYELHIVESEALQLDKVTVADIGKAIEETGHKAFYGIYFDTAKAKIKPTSKPSLDAMAEYILGTKRKFLVVGHTDGQGSLDANQSLSQRRAVAVVERLKKAYGIPGGRVQAVGVGPAAPMATNDTKSGRARNRRVELVAR